ncbi:MAG: hypothetical protein ACOYOQ_16395 [Microthrixaceae bacterium]
MSDIAFPYPTFAGEIQLVVVEPKLDGTPMAVEVQDHELRTITIRDLDLATWQTLVFDVVVKLTQAQLDPEVFHTPHVAIVADCKRSNTRYSRPMAPVYGNSSGEWRTTVSLDRGSWFGTVELSAVISATVDERDHRMIGRSPSWTLYLDDLPRPPITSAMSIKWVAFAEPDAEPAVLRTHEADPYHVELDDEDPTLYLNSSFNGLVGLLADRARPPGAERALHNATRAQIAVSAWQTLLVDAVAHIGLDDDDDEPEWPSASWRETILRKLLIARYGVDDDQALRNLVSEWKDPLGAMSITSSIATTAQHLGRLPKLLGQAIATLPETEVIDEEEAP